MKIKYINYLLCLVAIICSIYLVITRDNQVGLILKDLSIIFTITLLFIFEKLLKVKISDGIKFVYILFVFMAHFLGATIELYNKINYFDKVTHTLSGVLTGYLSLFLLFLMNKYNKNEKIFNIIYIIIFTLAVAAFWEIFEYSANILFGGDAQRVQLTGVNDTMQDIIVALLGSIMVVVIYLFYNHSKIFNFDDSIERLK